MIQTASETQGNVKRFWNDAPYVSKLSKLLPITRSRIPTRRQNDKCVELNPSVTLSKTLRIELHCHTHYSHDGLITFDGLVKAMRRRGLNAVCITDHDTIEGALDFQRAARKRGWELEFIVGEERTLNDGTHLIGLFLREHIQSTCLPEVIAEIQEQGGVVLIPHPFRGKDGLFRNLETPGEAMLDGITAFELFNAKSSYADNWLTRSLLETSLGVFGGSDAHYESDVGQCICELPFQQTIEASIRALLDRQVQFNIYAVPQPPGRGERRYAPLYYQVKPFIRVPRVLLPQAKQMYRWYRNSFRSTSTEDLELIYAYA